MVVYKTTNLVNGKSYIGKDSKNNPNYLGSGILLKKAIEKYGKENFIKEVLQECLTIEDLNKAEKWWIEKEDACKNPNSYNLANGGQGGDLSAFMDFEKRKGVSIHNKEDRMIRSIRIQGENNPMYGKKMSDEQKKKLSEANKNREYFFTEQHKKNLSKAIKGKKASAETREKMRKAHLGSTKKGKEVIQINEDGTVKKTYRSIREASSDLAMPYKEIQRILHGKKSHIILKYKHGTF